MFFSKKKKDDNISKPSGFGAVLHKSVMFLTYPFRKPWGILVILLLLAAAAYIVPIYVYKVPVKEVHTWYWEKIKFLETGDLSEVSNTVSNKFSKLLNKIPMLSEEPAKGTDRLVEAAPSQKEIRRQMFKAASAGAKRQKVDVLAEEADNVVAVEMPQPIVVAEENKKEEIRYQQVAEERKNGFDEKPVIVKKVSMEDGDMLRYLPQPEKISGLVKVYNANELDVGGTYIFLYGIYSSPKTSRGVKAGVFLKEALDGETVNCDILAYTADNVATGECFVEGISINKILVERGYSDRVSLQ